MDEKVKRAIHRARKNMAVGPPNVTASSGSAPPFGDEIDHLRARVEIAEGERGAAVEGEAKAIEEAANLRTEKALSTLETASEYLDKLRDRVQELESTALLYREAKATITVNVRRGYFPESLEDLRGEIECHLECLVEDDEREAGKEE